MNQRVKIVTWKKAQNRYLHIIEVQGRGYIHLITDSHCLWLDSSSSVFGNRALKKRDPNATKGMRLVNGEREQWLGEEEWEALCFGGDDNLELRKKIYDRKLGEVKIMMSVCPRSKRVDWIKKSGDVKNLILYRSVKLKRNPNKRIKDPLPYISFQPTCSELGERSVECEFIISELSFILFNQRVRHYGY